MLPDKQVKEQFRKDAAKNPDKFYPAKTLKELGFSRKTCKACGVNFWSIGARETCGNANCSGGFTFIGNPPTKKKFDYIQTWKEFDKFFTDLGYLSVPRKPVVARWRNDVYWVGASVYGFQPYVVSGEIKPPSNAVIIPQPSLRFNDIDNVGITGSHYVCFDMMGQLHFEKKEDYKIEKYFSEYFDWINKGMGIPKEELQIHEDAWAGGGNFGPCMEFFSRGLEIGNQVYMQYEQTESGNRELNIKVLDMGQGHERIPWLSEGAANSYETTFPEVVQKLKKITGVKYSAELMKKFLPCAAYLNVDEVEDINKTWNFVAGKCDMNASELKEKVLPLQAIYSIAEHSRAALFALYDGALPSNVGGGYNLRIILRRALSFIEKYNWDIDLAEVARWNADYLKPLFPELAEETADMKKILDSEKQKFLASGQHAQQIISKLNAKEITTEKLVDLYDSQGINPEQVAEEFSKRGQSIKVPDDIYALVAEKHANKEQKTATHKKEKLPLPELPATKKLYLQDWKALEFKAKVLYAKDKLVVLDQTAFYPISGGQMHDIGTLNREQVVETIIQDNVIVHIMRMNTLLKKDELVSGAIDFAQRKQLTQHHTGAHVVNLACQKILGRHVWQAGAAKTLEKARLDITHYEQISEKQMKEIENYCNKIIKDSFPVKKELLPREIAEEKYGMRIYQGGFVPGRELRIVSIADLDHEACGGTHVNNTIEIENIKILNTSRIQDGVIRINYTCGNASKQTASDSTALIEQLAKLLGVKKNAVPARAAELFAKWKKAKKSAKSGEKIDTILSETKELNLSDDDLVKETAKIFSTQPEHIVKTARRFLEEIESAKKGK